MAQKLDVDIQRHTPWDAAVAAKLVKLTISKSASYYPKLLSNVEQDDREPTVRERLLFEDEGLRKFSVDHPRLFGLASSESVATDPSKRQMVYVLLYVNGLVASGAMDRQKAHDKFVALSMQVSTKSQG
jgi:hypothetical protein